MKIEIEVSRCRDCCYVTNTAQEWDDPFRSQPVEIAWWCQKKKYDPYGLSHHVKPNEIAPDCPFRKEANNENI